MSRLLAIALLISLMPVSASAADPRPCLACHKDKGSAPNLNGMDPDIFISELNEFKAGARKNPSMIAIARSLSYKDMRELAELFRIGSVGDDSDD